MKNTPVRDAAWRRRLSRRLRDRSALVGVVGLGYVGLPLLVTAARVGFRAAGVDLDPGRIEAIGLGRSYVGDVPGSILREIASSLSISTSYEVLRGCDVVVICVPTPLKDHDPDLEHIRAAGEGIAGLLDRGMLVILESTTYPGTTEEILRPILESSGLSAGRDFGLAYSPERIDPGRGLDHLAKTAKVVGGLTKGCGALAAEFYRAFVHEVHVVSSPREAELAKLIENTYRHVNIALMNELAFLSRDLDVDIWEAIRAAATKPFGFQPFWPGPGVGGHCIAIDPSYLSWRVGQRTGHRLNFVEHAQEVNARMPRFVVQRIGDALNARRKPLRGSRILGLGVAYKPDLADTRESPSIAVLELLAAAGAKVAYHDPFVPKLQVAGRTLRSRPLSPAVLSVQDCAVVLTAHSAVDYEMVVASAPLVFDARGVTRGTRSNVVRL
jgi:UDP-N-acetyl-D-glucosamine dehydrogenase